jgi:hypothetical protein
MKDACVTAACKSLRCRWFFEGGLGLVLHRRRRSLSVNGWSLSLFSFPVDVHDGLALWTNNGEGVGWCFGLVYLQAGIAV